MTIIRQTVEKGKTSIRQTLDQHKTDTAPPVKGWSVKNGSWCKSSDLEERFGGQCSEKMTLFSGGWPHHYSATSVQCSEMMTLFLGVATTLQPPRPTWHLITPSPRTNNIQGFFLYLRNCPVWEEKRNSQKRELFSGLFCTDTNFMLIMMSPLFLSFSLYAHHLSQCLCLCICFVCPSSAQFHINWLSRQSICLPWHLTVMGVYGSCNRCS